MIIKRLIINKVNYDKKENIDTGIKLGMKGFVLDWIKKV